MGSDKGLIQADGTVRSKIIYNLLKKRFPDVYVSIREDQEHSYKEYFNSETFIFDSLDFPSLRGPLLGLTSFSVSFPDEYFFVLACDMPDMHESVIDLILNKVKSEKNFDCYAAYADGRIEPLCGIYTSSSVLNYIKNTFPANADDLSLHTMIESLQHIKVEIPSNLLKYMKNYNYPDPKTC